MNGYTLDDLREIHVRDYIQEPTSTYIRNRNGRRVPVTHGVEYVSTKNASRLRLDKWLDLVRNAIEAEGKQELFEQIREHCRAHYAWLRTEKELEEYALSCLCNCAFEHWEGFRQR